MVDTVFYIGAETNDRDSHPLKNAASASIEYHLEYEKRTDGLGIVGHGSVPVVSRGGMPQLLTQETDS